MTDTLQFTPAAPAPVDPAPPAPPAQPAPVQRYAQCDQCGAPLDDRQRHCVQCGARRLQGDDPASRYLADLSRRARLATEVTTVVPPSSQSRGTTLAVVLALIPVAAGIGVVVGRGQGTSDKQIIDALKAQRAPVVNVTGGGTGTAASADTADASASAAKAKKDKSAKGPSKGKLSDGAEILATGPAGSARKLEGAKPTPKQLEESKAAVKRINESKGKAYVESQRDLPDQIVIP